MQPREAQAFNSAFQAIDQLIRSFRNSLPALSPSAAGAEKQHLRPLILAHTVTNAAIIKLHNPFTFNDANSSAECMAAARMIVNDVQEDLGFVNPLMGVSHLPSFTPLRAKIKNVVLTSSHYGSQHARSLSMRYLNGGPSTES